MFNSIKQDSIEGRDKRIRPAIEEPHRQRLGFPLTMTILTICCALFVLWESNLFGQGITSPGNLPPGSYQNYFNPFTLGVYPTAEADQRRLAELLRALEQYDKTGDPMILKKVNWDAGKLGLEPITCKPRGARCTSDDECCSKNCDSICYGPK